MPHYSIPFVLLFFSTTIAVVYGKMATLRLMCGCYANLCFLYCKEQGYHWKHLNPHHQHLRIQRKWNLSNSLQSLVGPLSDINVLQKVWSIFFAQILHSWCLVSITGEPKPTVKWSKDNQKNTIERHLGSVKQNKFYLILEDVTPYDSGLYTCNVSNSLGWIGFTFELLVQGKQMLMWCN